MKLPEFKYHPDPIGTGSIKTSDQICGCCGKSRGYAYQLRMSAVAPPEVICPWCIADGSGAEKYSGMYCDDLPLIEDGLAEEIIEEVTKRTPGFPNWQQDVWLSHCRDACEFHGEISKTEMKNMSLEQFQSAFQGDTRLDEYFLPSFEERYCPGGNPAIYKWLCRKCKTVLFYADYT